MDLLNWLFKNFNTLIIPLTLGFVTLLYFKNNPLKHGKKFMLRRFINWFPLGMTYAFLYMGRYNLSVAKNALGTMMDKEAFGTIAGVGAFVYGLSFLLNGPLVDKIGGKKGIIIAAVGSSIMNILMGGATYLFLNGKLTGNMTVTFSILYGLNMFFQSYGAVAIIKVKAYWFHVRERGVFGAIFGSLISMGAYFAFDWGQGIVDAVKLQTKGELSGFQTFLRTILAVDLGTVDAYWWVFIIPAFILLFWALIDLFLLKDTPEQAGQGVFNTNDASDDDKGNETTIFQLIKWLFSSRIMLIIAAIEFSSGVLRNGIMQWYFVFAKEVPQVGAEIIGLNWGKWIMITGILGGFIAGWVSDHVFHSRRGPPAVILNVIMFVFTSLMAVYITSSPIIVGVSCLAIGFAVIGVHSLMSGTAAADFGGKHKTATASGIVDGFVYLGSGLQSIVIGKLTMGGEWGYWPVFLVPFTIMGAFFAFTLWNELPAATKRYLKAKENVEL